MKCRHEQDGKCLIGEHGGNPQGLDCYYCEKYSGPPRGLGDITYLMTKWTGVERVAKAIEKKTGKPCGCKERRRKWNGIKDDAAIHLQQIESEQRCREASGDGRSHDSPA